MPDFKTHLNALLGTFGLDFSNAQDITLNYEANTTTSTYFDAPCDGFLILFCGSVVTSAYIADVSWDSRNAANVGGSSWLSVNTLVSKGRRYALCVTWTSTPVGNSQGLFVPFNFSRQKS